ncbi:MAG: GNAT family N-acetyltransferase [Pseudomonadota bacterium]
MRTVTPASERAVRRVLSEAFRNDPVMNWICPKPAFVAALFRLLTPLYSRQGFAMLTDEYTAATLWMTPAKDLRPGLSALPAALRVLSLCGLAGLRRIRRFERASKRAKPTVPFFYLFAIGVVDQAKGLGVGSQILKHTLQRCDAAQTPAYLENSNRANLGFYQKHGFEVIEEVVLDDDGPTVWLMLRQPR